MPRRPRAASESIATIHHVLNRGVDRQHIFFGDADRIEFGRRLADAHDRFGVTTLAYCLMSNHYHLVLRAPLEKVSDAMHHLGTTYVRHTNDRVGRDGPMFRSRFVALPVSDDAYLRTLIRYVHRNALDLPGVRSPAEYRWSSYRAYLGHRRPPGFLDTSLVLALFDDDVRALAAFTETSMEEPPTAGETALAAIVDRELAVERLSVGSGVSTPRPSVVLAAFLDHPNPAIRAAAHAGLGHPSEDALRMARSRGRRRVEGDPVLRRVLARINGALVTSPGAA